MRAIWMRDRDRESDGADMPDATKDYSMAAKATPRTSMKSLSGTSWCVEDG